MPTLERPQFQYVYAPDRGRELLIPTPESLFNGFRNTAHNRKNFQRVKNACSKAYSNLQSGYYLDAERLFSEVPSQIPVTLGFLLVRGVTQLMISDLHNAKANLELGLGVSIDEGDTLFEAAFRINLGQLYPDLAKGTLGKSVLDNAIELCKSQGNSSLLMVALRQQALVHLFLGAPEKSEILVQSGMAIANSGDRRNELTFLYYVLGILRYATGDLHSAEKHLLRSIETGRSVKRAPISRAWSQVGLLRLLLGNPDGARNAVEKTLETAKQGGNNLDVARAVGLGFTLEVATGNRTPDAVFFDPAIEMERRSGYRFGIIRHHLILAKLCLQHQDVQSASDLCRAAGSLADEIGHEVAKIEIRGLIALLSMETGDEGIFNTLEDCIESCRYAGIPLVEAEMHQLLGSAYTSSGLVTDACRCFEAAAELSGRIGARLEEAKALGLLAQAQEMQGEQEKASESAATAQAIIQSMGVGLDSVPGP